MTTISTIGLYCALREAPFVVPRDYVEQYGRRDELRRYRLHRRAIDNALFFVAGEAGDKLRPQRLWLPAQLKQLVSCSKCGADRNNCALSRRNCTRAKKRGVKSARSIWSMIHRLNPMKDKNRIAAAKQVYDSRVRHFSRATYLSNAFQNVR
jgi:hypothetical protein